MTSTIKPFNLFELGINTRSVIDVEHERIARGYPVDEALLKHGRDIEDAVVLAIEKAAISG